MALEASKIRLGQFLYYLHLKNKHLLIINELPCFLPHEIVRKVEIMGCSSRIFTRVGYGREILKSQTKNCDLGKGFLKNYARKL